MKGEGTDDKSDAPPEIVLHGEIEFEFKTPSEVLPPIREEVQTYLDTHITDLSTKRLDEKIIKVLQRFRDNWDTFADAVDTLRDSGWYVRLLIDDAYGRLSVADKFKCLKYIVVSPSTGAGDVFSLWHDPDRKLTNGWAEREHTVRFSTIHELLKWRHEQESAGTGSGCVLA